MIWLNFWNSLLCPEIVQLFHQFKLKCFNIVHFYSPTVLTFAWWWAIFWRKFDYNSVCEGLSGPPQPLSALNYVLHTDSNSWSAHSATSTAVALVISFQFISDTKEAICHRSPPLSYHFDWHPNIVCLLECIFTNEEQHGWLSFATMRGGKMCVLVCVCVC